MAPKQCADPANEQSAMICIGVGAYVGVGECNGVGEQTRCFKEQRHVGEWRSKVPR